MGKIISAFLIVFAASVMLFSSVATAQVQTYSYVGKSFDYANCNSINGTPPCVNGSVTASIILNGVSNNYTGTLGTGSVFAFYMNASNVSSLTSPLTGFSLAIIPLTYVKRFAILSV